jgi:hypothetical protein
MYPNPESLGMKPLHKVDTLTGDNMRMDDVQIPVPNYMDLPDGTSVSPLSSEPISMPFDFDIGALNQFLTSGDFDALMNLPQPDGLVPPATQSQRPLPRPSDAIKSAWFTNMEEKDLESEAAMLRSVTYNTINGYPNSYTGRSEPDSESSGSKGKIDEAWRQKVNSELVPRVFNVIGPLPSIEFLVRAQLFWPLIRL